MGTEKQTRTAAPSAVKQQGRPFFTGGILQRQSATATPTTAPRQATSDEQREFVREAIRYLTDAADFYRLARLTDERFERIFTGLLSVYQNNENIINTSLNADATLLQELQRAFTAALRALMLRAAAQLNKPLIRLYLENMHRIPSWAWPDSSVYALTDETRRREFVRDFSAALRDATLFAGYATLNQVSLETILQRLNTLVSDTQIMIAAQLGNDVAVKQQVQTAYSFAVETLLTRAATTMGQNVFSLFMQYRYGANPLIHEWADKRFGGLSAITTSLPLGTGGQDPITGEVSFPLNGFQVIVEPDTTQTGSGAATHAGMNWTLPGFHHTGGRVDSFNAVSMPVIRIRTAYGPGAGVSSLSGYGRGTTAEDVRRGDTSLGFHEGSHGHDFLQFIYNNPAPVFTGTVGMTTAAFNAARQQYQTALQRYQADLNRFSETRTDCVGSPTIQQYYQNLNPPQPTPVRCP